MACVTDLAKRLYAKSLSGVKYPMQQAPPTTPEHSPLLGMLPNQIKELCASQGQAEFRAKQLYQWIYHHAADSYDAMSNLPKAWRDQLASGHQIGRVAPHRVDISSDGTKKYLFATSPGRFVESAWIPENQRATLCLSTQVGCKMGCVFCATGRQGFQSQLTAGQIVNQYLSLPERESITNIVYMGMGEPFDNPEAVFDSLALFTDPLGIGLSPHKITVSTIGIIPVMKEFLVRSDCNLDISIHSPFEDERRALMPIQHVYPIAELVQVLKENPLAASRKLSFEYIMFAGLNDSLGHARELVRLINGLRAQVNLIHYHSVPSLSLQGSDDQTMRDFQDLLKQKGIMTTIRKSRGLDIQAACGLLSTKELVKTTLEDF